MDISPYISCVRENLARATTILVIWHKYSSRGQARASHELYRIFLSTHDNSYEKKYICICNLTAARSYSIHWPKRRFSQHNHGRRYRQALHNSLVIAHPMTTNDSRVLARHAHATLTHTHTNTPIISHSIDDVYVQFNMINKRSKIILNHSCRFTILHIFSFESYLLPLTGLPFFLRRIRSAPPMTRPVRAFIAKIVCSMWSTDDDAKLVCSEEIRQQQRKNKYIMRIINYHNKIYIRKALSAY